jgi:hypothetical protein
MYRSFGHFSFSQAATMCMNASQGVVLETNNAIFSFLFGEILINFTFNEMIK